MTYTTICTLLLRGPSLSLSEYEGSYNSQVHEINKRTNTTFSSWGEGKHNFALEGKGGWGPVGALCKWPGNLSVSFSICIGSLGGIAAASGTPSFKPELRQNRYLLVPPPVSVAQTMRAK